MMRRTTAGARSLAVTSWVAALLGVTAPAGSAEAAVAVQPTRGGLLYETGDPERPLAELPLEKTDVRARILGFVGRVEVQQTFNNPFKDPLEAIYVFPLPQDASIGEMSIEVGDRTIRSRIATRSEARKLYERAKRQGKLAALLDQERPNVFTQAVANIEPGRKVVVRIRYDVRLSYDSGVYQFTYPMVVGPRYIPGKAKAGAPSGAGRGPDTDRVPDGSRISPPIRKPGSPAGHDVSMVVTVDPGTSIAKLWSPTHEVDVDPDKSVSPTALRVTLSAGDRIPNKDFVVRYRIASKKPALSVIAQRDDGQGYLTLLLEPPAIGQHRSEPVDFVFVIDASSRMAGEPMALVKRALRRAFSEVSPDDTFRIVRFSDRASELSKQPLDVTPKNLRRARSYVNGIRAGGGTELAAGLRVALGPAPSEGRRRVVVLMSNGHIGDESAVLSALAKLVDGSTRLHVFGAGSSPNRYLLERAAELGRGSSQYVLLTESAEDAMKGLLDRVRAPVLTDVKVDWRGLAVTDAIPSRLPDLHAGHPVSMVGRFRKPGKGTITLRGTRGGKPVSFEVPIRVVPSSPALSAADSEPGEGTRTRGGLDHGAIGRLWARAKIAELMLRPSPQSAGAVEKLGLRHGLVTRYTSLVAVGERVVVDNGTRKKFVIPVEMPEGVSFEAVFGTELDANKTRPHGAGDAARDRHVIRDGGAGGETADARAPVPDSDDERVSQVAEGAPGYVGRTLSGDVMLTGEGGRRWQLGAGFGAGFTNIGDDDSGGAAGIQLRVGRVMAPRWQAGGELGLLLPLFDTGDQVWTNLLLQLRYAGLLSGKLQLSGGAGGSLAGGDLGLSYMGAVELLPIPNPLGAGLQLRFDGVSLPDRPDLQSYTLGIRLSF